jgi:hypothetical protein
VSERAGGEVERNGGSSAKLGDALGDRIHVWETRFRADDDERVYGGGEG